MTILPTKAARHQRIIDLLEREPVRSQGDLVELLSKDGVNVTQATLSRDLDELGAVKVRTEDGSLVYAVQGEGGDRTARAAVLEASAVERLRKRCEDVLVSVDSSANMVVLRTPPGAAQFLASAIDHTVFPDVIGTVAGDDTIFMVTRDPSGGAVVAQQLLDLVEAPSSDRPGTARNAVSTEGDTP